MEKQNNKPTKFEEFQTWLIDSKKPQAFTRNQSVFAELLIKNLEKDKGLKDMLIAVGDMTKPFDLVQQFYHQVVREQPPTPPQNTLSFVDFCLKHTSSNGVVFEDYEEEEKYRNQYEGYLIFAIQK